MLRSLHAQTALLFRFHGRLNVHTPEFCADGQGCLAQSARRWLKTCNKARPDALNKLIPSPANVRKTGAAIGIEELAASIAAHALLQNLQVREGKVGKFEVVAGGRRLAALNCSPSKAVTRVPASVATFLETKMRPRSVSRRT